MLASPPRLSAPIEIVSLSLAPTWNVKESAPPKTVLPLNFVSVTIELTSLAIWKTSELIALLSSSSSVPLLYWTFRSRTRCSIE